jgi:hypothetical protein
MDVSGRILRTWIPAIHAGMTNSPFSCSGGERKIMKHFVVKKFLLEWYTSRNFAPTY